MTGLKETVALLMEIVKSANAFSQLKMYQSYVRFQERMDLKSVANPRTFTRMNQSFEYAMKPKGLSRHNGTHISRHDAKRRPKQRQVATLLL